MNKSPFDIQKIRNYGKDTQNGFDELQFFSFIKNN